MTTPDFLKNAIPYEEQEAQATPDFLRNATPYEPEPISPKAKAMAKNLDFFGMHPSEETIQNIRKPLIQGLVTPATHLVTGALGSFGDVAALLHNVIATPASKLITGKEGVSYEESPIGKLLPTSESMHKHLESLVGEKLRPESVGGEVLDQGLQFIGGMLGLNKGKFLGKGNIPFTTKQLPAVMRNLITSFVPAGVMVGAKQAELPGWAQASATVASSLLAHKLTGQSLPGLNAQLYKEADNLAQGIMIPGGSIANETANLQTEMSKAFKSATPKARIYTLSDELLAKAQGGDIPLTDLMQMRKEALDESNLLLSKERKMGDKFWNMLIATIDNGIKKYEAINPQFSKVYRQANGIYKGRMKTGRIESFIGELIRNHKELTGATALGGGIATKFLGLAFGAPIAKGVAGFKSYLFLRSMMKNPEYRKAWTNLMYQASKESVKGTASALKKFNELSEKEGISSEEEYPY